eukprot:gene439-465_t
MCKQAFYVVLLQPFTTLTVRMLASARGEGSGDMGGSSLQPAPNWTTCASSILRQEGVRGLYAGVSVSLLLYTLVPLPYWSWFGGVLETLALRDILYMSQRYSTSGGLGAASSPTLVSPVPVPRPPPPSESLLVISGHYLGDVVHRLVHHLMHPPESTSALGELHGGEESTGQGLTARSASRDRPARAPRLWVYGAITILEAVPCFLSYVLCRSLLAALCGETERRRTVREARVKTAIPTFTAVQEDRVESESARASGRRERLRMGGDPSSDRDSVAASGLGSDNLSEPSGGRPVADRRPRGSNTSPLLGDHRVREGPATVLNLPGCTAGGEVPRITIHCSARPARDQDTQTDGTYRAVLEGARYSDVQYKDLGPAVGPVPVGPVSSSSPRGHAGSLVSEVTCLSGLPALPTLVSSALSSPRTTGHSQRILAMEDGAGGQDDLCAMKVIRVSSQTLGLVLAK